MPFNAAMHCTGNHFKCTGCIARLHRSVVFGQTFRLNDRHIKFDVPIGDKNVTVLRLECFNRDLTHYFKNITNKVWWNWNWWNFYRALLINTFRVFRTTANIGKWDILFYESRNRWKVTHTDKAQSWLE